MSLVGTILRLLLGLLLLATAIGKLLDLPGFAGVLSTYHLLPASALFSIAVTLALIEMALSAWLLSGVGLAYSALAAVLLHLVFVAVAVNANLRGLHIPNCGCFGVYWARPMTWATVAEDVVLTALCIALFLLARRGNRGSTGGQAF